VDGTVPAPPKDDTEREAIQKRWDSMIRESRSPDYPRNASQILVGMFTPETDPVLRERIELAMLAAPQHVAASAREGMEAFALQGINDAYPKLRAIAMMVKRGDPARYRTFLSQHFHLIDYVEFEGSGHFVMMEQPDKFNAALRAFLDNK
jgi:pimeloyl-ACP methyl ester carboxylesterase